MSDFSRIEAEQEYKGYHCIVLFYDGGWRCGYVGLPKGHQLSHIRTEKAFELLGQTSEIHGGITFSDFRIPTNDEIHSPYPIKWYLGYDNHHGMDGYDFNKVREYWGYKRQLDAQKCAMINGLFSLDRLEQRHCATVEEVLDTCHTIVDKIEQILTKGDKDNGVQRLTKNEDTEMERD